MFKVTVFVSCKTSVTRSWVNKSSYDTNNIFKKGSLFYDLPKDCSSTKFRTGISWSVKAEEVRSHGSAETQDRSEVCIPRYQMLAVLLSFIVTKFLVYPILTYFLWFLWLQIKWEIKTCEKKFNENLIP